MTARDRHCAPATERARARTLRVGAHLLGYPDDDWWAQLPLIETTVAALEPAARPLFQRFLAHAMAAEAGELQRAYVDTFDLRRRNCLYLTYYSHGDTRKRGMALLRFTHAYRAAGYELTPEELPDHLAVVCEFAAAEPDAGLALFAEQRAGLELLRLSLHETASPWLDVVDAILAVLPPAATKDLDAALVLARSGPPAEEVGLEPFAPPEYMGGRR